MLIIYIHKHIFREDLCRLSLHELNDFQKKLENKI